MKEKILQLLQNQCALPEDIREESEFALLSLDSLSFICFLVEVEQELGIEFEIEEMAVQQWGTVGDFLKKAEEKYAEKQT